MLKKTMEIFRKVVNVFILCLICIKNFFFSQSWGRFSFLKRFIAEFLSVGGLLVLIKWAFGKKLQFNLLKNIFPLTVMVIIIEITRMVRRAEKKLYSLKKIKPHREQKTGSLPFF